jgi:Na+-driven multidrug efflux pump
MFFPLHGANYCRALALPFSMLTVACQAACRAHLDLRTPLIAVLAVGVVNLALDPIVLFGLHGGLAGAAWVTVVSQVRAART